MANCVGLPYGAKRKDTVSHLRWMLSMLRTEKLNANSTVECWKSRISYIKEDDIICIEHFSETGQLLSEIKMNYDDAYDYARHLVDVIDKAIGV